MSEKDGFGSGFFLGTLVGSIIGGALGAIIASRQNESSPPTTRENTLENGNNTEETMETARRSLEDKISQLNLAIDDVRQQLGGVKPEENQ